MPTLVAFLPGIMGSALTRTEGDTERPIWSDKTLELLRLLVRYGNLTCYPNDLETVRPSRLMGKVSTFFVTLFPGYDDVIALLKREGFEADSLLRWPYDWRQSIATLAPMFLKDLAARQTAGGFDRLVIIAHSMGCLVARMALTLDRQR